MYLLIISRVSQGSALRYTEMCTRTSRGGSLPRSFRNSDLVDLLSPHDGSDFLTALRLQPCFGRRNSLSYICTRNCYKTVSRSNKDVSTTHKLIVNIPPIPQPTPMPIFCGVVKSDRKVSDPHTDERASPTCYANGCCWARCPRGRGCPG